MTPIELALAKAAGALMDTAKDKVTNIAFGEAKKVFVPHAGAINSVKNLVNGFQTLGQIKEAKKEFNEFKDEHRDRKRRKFDLEVARKRISNDFNQMIESMNPPKKSSRTKMRMVANRIKKKKKKRK